MLGRSLAVPSGGALAERWLSWTEKPHQVLILVRASVTASRSAVGRLIDFDARRVSSWHTVGLTDERRANDGWTNSDETNETLQRRNPSQPQLADGMKWIYFSSEDRHGESDISPALCLFERLLQPRTVDLGPQRPRCKPSATPKWCAKKTRKKLLFQTGTLSGNVSPSTTPGFSAMRICLSGTTGSPSELPMSAGMRARPAFSSSPERGKYSDSNFLYVGWDHTHTFRLLFWNLCLLSSWNH